MQETGCEMGSSAGPPELSVLIPTYNRAEYPGCINYVKKPFTYDEFCYSCEMQGRSRYLFSKLHPDPLIRRFCMVEDAERKWRSIQKQLDERILRVRELEALLLSEGGSIKDDGGLRGLFNLYGWTFNALKIKGYFEARRDAGEAMQEAENGNQEQRHN